MEKQPSLEVKKAIIEELVRGRELANQLLELVRHESTNNKGSAGQEFVSVMRPFAEDLVTKILRSFTNTLLLCNTNRHNGVSFVDSPSSAWNICEESQDQNLDGSCSSLRKRNPRGCYKRNGTIQRWEKDSPILTDDGYAWRKYGQKMTTNARYIRNYYRCSHKHDQGCAATKQVQRIQENPPLYRTIYFGLHTCKIQMLPAEMTWDPTSPPPDFSVLLSFNNTRSTLPSEQDYPHSFFSSSSTKKEQHDRQQIIPTDHADVEQNHVSQYEPVTVLSSTLDVFSSVKLESYYEADDDDDDVLYFMRCFDFDDVACFGERSEAQGINNF